MSDDLARVVMIVEKVNHDYFEWLISQIKTPGRRSYHELFTRFHDTEFVWTVPHDDNRVRDGLDLRVEFLNDHTNLSRKAIQGFDDGRVKGATVLEIIVSLSRRVAFTAGGEADEWAWQLIENIHLNRMYDPLSRNKVDKIDEILDALIWRTYERNGEGGFFPLEETFEDQTKVEIWYQMNAYVNEIQEP